MSVLIRNGILVNSSGTMPADVLIIDRKISVVSSVSLSYEAGREIDAAGSFILPGGVDPHVHMHLPSVAGYSSDDFLSGSRAALSGATTTIIDFVTPARGESLPHALEKRMLEAEKSLTDYAFHVSPVEWRNSTPDEIRECIRMGVTSFKVYMAYRNTVGLDQDDLLKVLKSVGKTGGTVTVHCEEGDEIERLRDHYFRSDPSSPLSHALSRPAELEASAVKKAVRLAAKADCPLYIVHVSSKESLEHISQARLNKQPVFGETCPQYLLFDDSKYSGSFDQAASFVISPPLRTPDDKKALWEALADGTLDTVGTDHCPFTMEQKRAGAEDFRKIPGGAGGVEHRLALLYTYGFLTKRLTFNQVVNLYSTEPSKIFGLYPRKGEIAPGADADLVVWNPEPESVIRTSAHQMNCDVNIYEGMTVRGLAEYVIKAGTVVVEKGRIHEPVTPGKFLFRTIT